MPKKKNPKKKSSRININIHLPKQLQGTGGSGYGVGKKAGAAVASIMIANPLVSIVVIIIALVLMLILGSFVLTSVVTNLLDWRMWLLALLISMALKPKGTMAIIGGAVAMGMVFWIYELWAWYQAMQDVCGIPIIGWMICGLFDIALFMPRIFALGMLILSAFIMLTGLSALRFAILKR